MRTALASAVALALILVPSAVGTHPGFIYDRSMNLDGDAALERVKATDNASHTNPRATVVAYDVCNGTTILHELASPGTWMVRSQLRGTRALGRPGLLFAMGYGQEGVIVRVVRLRRQNPGECPTPVALFDYSSTAPPLPPPSGLILENFWVTVGNFSKKYSGRELCLEEVYARSTSGPIRSHRRTYFRYSVRTEQYESYRTTLRPA